MKNKMSDNKINWWIIVAVVIVVAVVASLITVNLTGNVIKLNQDRFGKYQSYTTAEVDNLLASKATNAGVLDMLSKCSITVVSTTLVQTTNCNKVCTYLSKNCIAGFIENNKYVNNSVYQEYIYPTPCSQNSTVGGITNLYCNCCSATSSSSGGGGGSGGSSSSSGGGGGMEEPG